MLRPWGKLMGRLLHYSAEPLTAVHSREQDIVYKHFKPKGLWVSVEGEDDWKSWCEAEGFQLHQLAYVTEVILTPQAHILRLTNPYEVKAFSDQYAYAAFGMRTGLKMGVPWDQVAKLYQGVIIAPYCWSIRLDDDCFWYYTWDCASGCIWDATAVATLIPAGPQPCAK